LGFRDADNFEVTGVADGDGDRIVELDTDEIVQIDGERV
jgi:hypothetical protein